MELVDSTKSTIINEHTTQTQSGFIAKHSPEERFIAWFILEKLCSSDFFHWRTCSGEAAVKSKIVQGCTNLVQQK